MNRKFSASPSPSNILIISEGQIGDMLLLTPAIRSLKGAFPSAALLLLVVERRDVGSARDFRGELLVRSKDTALQTNPYLSGIYSLRRDYLRMLSGMRRMRAEWEIVRFIRSRKVDIVISSFPEDRFALWAFLSGAKIRIGSGKGGFGSLYTHHPSSEKEGGSVIDYYLDLIRVLGIPVDSRETEYVPGADATEWAEETLRRLNLLHRRFVVVHPGATGDYKIWPPERFARLIDGLREQTGIPVVVCEGPQDADVVESLISSLKTTVHEVSTIGKIDNFAAIIQRAALCISNDSGPRHLAVAVGTPSLALFRLHHDRDWNPYPESRSVSSLKARGNCPLCPPGRCEDRLPAQERYGAACLRMVEDESVLQRALEMLKAGERAPA